MKTKLSILWACACVVACGEDRTGLPPNSEPRSNAMPSPVDIEMMHGVGAPYAPEGLDLSFVSEDNAAVATERGIRFLKVDGQNVADPGSAGAVEIALTSVGSGAAATQLVTAGDSLFFLPTGRPQVGAIDIASFGADFSSEAALTVPLSSSFPTALLAGNAGAASGRLWVVDSVLGPGSAVRAYDHRNFSSAHSLSEAENLRYSPAQEDFDGDGSIDVLVGAKLGFHSSGNIGFMSFTILGGTAPRLGGGIDAFDVASGERVARILVPNIDSSTTTIGFVGTVATDGSRLYTIVAEKGPNFSEVGGQLAIYEIESQDPFRVRDENASMLYDQPKYQLATSAPNPIGLLIVDGSAIVFSAPFFGNGTIDVFDLTTNPPSLSDSIDVGPVYVTGFNLPSDPKLSPDGSFILIGTEAGLLRARVMSK